MPSITPTDSALAPSTLTRNTGSKLWIISDDASISMLTNPSATTPDGMRGGVAVVAGVLIRIRDNVRPLPT